ncbi:cytokine receptor-like factor 2 [Pyxicephalus adspersus]|uniref:cytokine receptor-like factor 2 n=1 Tax=Pyxicephalus adspersus TaxID=30357 RepID=UPI003B59AAF8
MGHSSHSVCLAIHQTFHMDRLVLAMFILFYTLLTDGVHADINIFEGPPQNMTLKWGENKMNIQSAQPQFGQTLPSVCFVLVLQFRTRNTMEWQISKESSSCTTNTFSFQCLFSNLDLDVEKCYEMQAQFKVENFCLENTPKSQWSSSVFMKNGSLHDLCPEVVTNRQTAMEMQKLIIILFSSVLSVLFLLIIFVGCFMNRVKKCVFPMIPDPKNAFHDLYDSHNGYVQEWTKTSINNSQLEEIESVMDEQDEDQNSIKYKDNEATILDNQCMTEEPVDTAITTLTPLAENVSDACFANMNFTMNDSMYIML